MPWTPMSSIGCMRINSGNCASSLILSIPEKQLNWQFLCIQDSFFVFTVLWLFHNDIFWNSWQDFLIKYAFMSLMDIPSKKGKYLYSVFWFVMMKTTVFIPSSRLLLTVNWKFPLSQDVQSSGCLPVWLGKGQPLSGASLRYVPLSVLCTVLC